MNRGQRTRIQIAAAALLLGAFALIACSGGSRAADDTPAPTTTPAPVSTRTSSLPLPPGVDSVRRVCRLIADSPDAASTQLRGADGATSVSVGGRTLWLFGDTVRNGPGGRQDVIPAAAATSTDTDGSDCVRLAFKQAGGLAQPLFPRLEETTSWPDGAIALDDGSVAFYIVKIYRQSPFAWNVASIGLGRVPPGSTDGVRVLESIWDDRSGFGSRLSGVRSPVRLGADVIVYIRTEAGDNLVARAPLARMGDAAAYTYWTGEAWSPRPADAAPMWPRADNGFPPDNGVTVVRDPQSDGWLAIYNAGLASVAARWAPQPWGPGQARGPGSTAGRWWMTPTRTATARNCIRSCRQTRRCCISRSRRSVRTT
ncbi:MAG: DUF4185 domain-containing protein [Chloroflexi bacterium]|nr:DUF4185 domain-containing protein [Chloroflexota bacterium]